MSTVVVIAPHPDDETLGCGGTLLKHLANGDNVHWVIATQLSESVGFSGEKVASRSSEIKAVAKGYGFCSVTILDYVTTTLSDYMLGSLITDLAKVLNKIKPDTVYAPYPGDVHSDHGVVFNAVSACSKSFRYPFIKKVCCYETLSETEFSISPLTPSFKPNLFVDISEFIDEKIALMSLYEGEMLAPPFPRSEENIRALAVQRGAVAGCESAEAFMLLKQLL